MDIRNGYKTMKKIKILGIETHFRTNGDKEVTSGVDFARVVLPLRELSKDKDFEVKIVKNPFKDNKETWDSLTKYYDIIYSSYIDSPEGYVNMAVHAKKNNCKVVVDCDDNMFKIPKPSPVYETYHIGSFALDVVAKILEDTEYMTTTNSFLKYEFIEWCKKRPEQIKVLPNFVDLDRYNKDNIKPKDNDKIIISFHGSNTHVVDLVMPEFLNGVTRIIKEFPNVEFHTTGLFLPQLKTKMGNQYKFILGHSDVYSWASELWPKMMQNADIVVAPLVQSDFSKSKSGIKFLENSAAMKPGVYEDIRQYQEFKSQDSEALLLAETEYEWYRELKKLVENEQLRKDMGKRAYELVKNKYQMRDNVHLYADYFKSLIR